MAILRSLTHILKERVRSMFKVIFYIIISIFIALIIALLFVVVHNIIINYRIKSRQSTKNIKMFSPSLLKNIMLILIISIVAITFTSNRSRIYMAFYNPTIIRGDCINLGDDRHTDESQLSFFNYIGIITIESHEDTVLFDILKEDEFPLPYETDVYKFQELARSRGENKANFLYDKNYLEKNNVYISDICDDVLDLENDKTYFVFGNYADEDYELNSYNNGIYIYKAVELKDYDVNKSVDEQTQEIIDLLDALGYFVDTTN